MYPFHRYNVLQDNGKQHTKWQTATSSHETARKINILVSEDTGFWLRLTDWTYTACHIYACPFNLAGKSGHAFVAFTGSSCETILVETRQTPDDLVTLPWKLDSHNVDYNCQMTYIFLDAKGKHRITTQKNMKPLYEVIIPLCAQFTREK